MANTLRIIGETLGAATTPMILIGNYARPVNEHGHAWLARNGIAYTLPGLDHGMYAAGRLAWWSERIGKPLELALPATSVATSTVRPADEWQVLAHLANFGVPVIPQLIARNAAEAAAHARAIGGPVVLKILSPDVAHKSDVGGVLLGMEGDVAVSAGYDQIMTSVLAKAPGAQVDGLLVSPMRMGGTELLVGIARDPVWGLVLAVGLGGVWVEVLNDTAICLLPASADEIKQAFASLRAAKLLQGYRGAPPVDLDRLANIVAGICLAAQALGPDLVAFEVNPLRVNGAEIEALDALAIWST
jgi:succinyl-CoA synthetase beta subunit